MGRGVMGRIIEGIRRRQEDSELQIYATEPPGAMGEKHGTEHDDEVLTVEEVERLCPECAESMRERGVSGVSLQPTIESGIFELAEDDDPEGVMFEREGKDGWPKRLKKGRFSAYCKREGFKGPSIACAKKAMDSDDESVRGMASFYMNTVQPGGKTATAVKGKEEGGPEPGDEKKEYGPGPDDEE